MTGDNLSDVMERATRHVPVPTEMLVERALARGDALRRRRRVGTGVAAAALVVGLGGGAALAPGVLDLGDSGLDPAGQGDRKRDKREEKAKPGGPLVLPGSERAVVTAGQLRDRLEKAVPAGTPIEQVEAGDLTEGDPAQTIAREVSAVIDGQPVTFTVFPADGVRPGGEEPRAQSRIDCFGGGVQGVGPGQCLSAPAGGWLYVDEASGLVIHVTYDGWRIEMAPEDGALEVSPDLAPGQPLGPSGDLNAVESLVLSDLWFQ